jgi:hypothetical protein
LAFSVFVCHLVATSESKQLSGRDVGMNLRAAKQTLAYLLLLCDQTNKQAIKKNDATVEVRS